MGHDLQRETPGEFVIMTASLIVRAIALTTIFISSAIQFP
jgi:hypothetical protein